MPTGQGNVASRHRYWRHKLQKLATYKGDVTCTSPVRVGTAADFCSAVRDPPLASDVILSLSLRGDNVVSVRTGNTREGPVRAFLQNFDRGPSKNNDDTFHAADAKENV